MAVTPARTDTLDCCCFTNQWLPWWDPSRVQEEIKAELNKWMVSVKISIAYSWTTCSNLEMAMNEYKPQSPQGFTVKRGNIRCFNDWMKQLHSRSSSSYCQHLVYIVTRLCWRSAGNDQPNESSWNHLMQTSWTCVEGSERIIEPILPRSSRSENAKIIADRKVQDSRNE